jgi:hypothetical protein
MSQWFRFYDEALNDPKVQRLPATVFKAWVNLLCVASKNGGHIPSVGDLAFALRVSETEGETLLETLHAAGLVDIDGASITPHNWFKRQYKSDTSSDRVRKFRSKDQRVGVETKRNASCNVSETPPDTEQKQIQSISKTTSSHSDGEPSKPSKPDFPPKAFETWWEAYPSKIGKAAAQRKFDTVRRSGTVTFEALMAGLEAYRRNKPPDRDWCHPTTWLNQGRWADEFGGASKSVDPAKAASVVEVRRTDPAWRHLEDRYRREKGKSPPGVGSWHFPREWVQAETAA